MTQVIKKYFLDCEKEEKWLNEMSRKGLQLSDKTGNRYTFEKGEENEYIYRIELLEDNLEAQTSDYLKFLEENNVEIINKQQRWVYLRKKSSEGDFQVYTDIDSKLKYYTRVNRYWLLLGISEILMSAGGMGRLADIIIEGQVIRTIDYLLAGLGLFVFVIGVLFIVMSIPIRKKIRSLKQEAEVHQ